MTQRRLHPRHTIYVPIVAGLALLPGCDGRNSAADSTSQRQRIACAAALHDALDAWQTFVMTYEEDGRKLERFHSASDGYEQGCYLHENVITWRADKTPTIPNPGRWRNEPRDGRFTVKIDGASVEVTSEFADGSKGTNSYDFSLIKASSAIP